MTFDQLPGEPAEVFEQLLIHRDLGPGRLFRQTAELVGCSESTLRRRSEQWQWVERLKAYDAALLDQINSDGHSQALKRHEKQLKEFRDKQLSRAQRVGELADELMALLKQSLKQQMDEGVMLRSREIPSVLSATCKSLEGAMNIEATALGVSELLDDLSK